MSLDEATRQQLESIIGQNPVTLFMKGNRDAPQCGFSSTVVRILDSLVAEYQTVDVLSDPAIREGVKEYSSWPTVPQLYVKGEFIGGCDIIQELFESQELHGTLGVPTGPSTLPTLKVSEPALEGLRQARAESGGDGREIHLSIDARFRTNLFLGPVGPNAVRVECGDVPILLDPVSASRADGIQIDVVETPQGNGFQIQNPNAPQVRTITVEDLKAAIEAGESFELLDVRTEDERVKAQIPGSQLLDEAEAARIGGLSRDTVLILHCHHGMRSQSAAEHFLALGFRDVRNVEGGIDAWSQRIDTSVPRY